MNQRTIGLVALSGFFWFGTIMASLTFLALLFPESGLAFIWRLNPQARAAFLTMGSWAAVLMLVVATACAIAAIGLRLRALWGYRLAVAILVANMVGDIGNAAIRGELRTLIGIPIAGAMIAYLLTAGIRRQFRATNLTG